MVSKLSLASYNFDDNISDNESIYNVNVLDSEFVLFVVQILTCLISYLVQNKEKLL